MYVDALLMVYQFGMSLFAAAYDLYVSVENLET